MIERVSVNRGIYPLASAPKLCHHARAKARPLDSQNSTHHSHEILEQRSQPVTTQRRLTFAYRFDLLPIIRRQRR